MFDDDNKLIELKKLHKYGTEKIKYEDAINEIKNLIAKLEEEYK